ncbi:hypothetical protein RYA05_06020 [Pseudomonas syringae pv. actinidiae]|nr:hypothetical protein [Pseudomonas syringae pv. actinidiae]
MDKIPLSQSDFDGGTFSKIAKFISKKWPSPDGKPSLSKSQAILSEILGYRDFHDASKSAGDSYAVMHWGDDFELSLSDAAYKAISQQSPWCAEYVNFKVVDEFCESIPFCHLSFFKKNKPQVNISDEAVSLFILNYEWAVVNHQSNAKTHLHSLAGCVAYALDAKGGLDLLLRNSSIKDALQSVQFPGGAIALNFVKGELHDLAVKRSFEDFCNSSNKDSIYTLKDCEGFSHRKYLLELSTPECMAILSDKALSHLESNILTKSCGWIFDAGIGAEKIEFDPSNWCMSHPYPFLDGDADDEGDDDYDDEFRAEFLEDMQIHHDRAQQALDFCKTAEDETGSEGFEIFYVDPDGMESFGFYNWIFRKKDCAGNLSAIICGIAFSPSLQRGVTAGNMMDLADTQSAPDCDSVSWTLGEYQKSLPNKYKEIPLYTLPIEKLTSNPTVIVHLIERSFSGNVPKGSGFNFLSLTIKDLVDFFGSDINLSVMINPGQFRNNKVAPGVIRASKDMSSARLAKYFSDSLSPLSKFGIKNLFLPRGYSDLSD